MITVLYGSNDLAIRRYVEEIVGSTNSSETLDPLMKLLGQHLPHLFSQIVELL